MNETPVGRLAEVVRRWPALGDTFRDGDLIESHSNDVWRAGGRYLRVCWRGDRHRLAKEAAVLAHLPPSVPAPEVLDAGGDAELTWMVTRAVAGENLEAGWPAMSDGARRDAIHQWGAALRALHAWEPTAPVAAAMATSTSEDPDEIAGSDLVPLPVVRAHRLVEAAADRGIVDGALARDLRARLDDLGAFDPLTTDDRERAVVVHGDLSIGNVLWSEGHLAAVVDFEWARLGPPDLELLAVCGTSPTPIERWTFEAYPDAFAHPHLRERLWLYALASTLRQRIVWGTAGSLREVVDGIPSSVDRLVRAAG